VDDPVGSGFAESLARPGGRLTGFSFVGPELAAKNLEFLKLAAPGPRISQSWQRAIRSSH
jgi:putative ABC transport system substrate-binding protein